MFRHLTVGKFQTRLNRKISDKISLTENIRQARNLPDGKCPTLNICVRKRCDMRQLTLLPDIIECLFSLITTHGYYSKLSVYHWWVSQRQKMSQSTNR